VFVGCGRAARGIGTAVHACRDVVHTEVVNERHARELLDLERARIEHALADLTPAHGGERDPVDVAPELVASEIDRARVEQLREELGAIERAERRLADGTYGRSVESGEPIPDARLEAIPWAERTVEEQARR
jgi:DnaK suppressor protein